MRTDLSGSARHRGALSSREGGGGGGGPRPPAPGEERWGGHLVPAVMPRPAVHPASLLSPGCSRAGRPSCRARAWLGRWSCGRGTGPGAREGVSPGDRQGGRCHGGGRSLSGFLGAFSSAPRKEPLCCSVAHLGLSHAVTPARGVSSDCRPPRHAFHGHPRSSDKRFGSGFGGAADRRGLCESSCLLLLPARAWGTEGSGQESRERCRGCDGPGCRPPLCSAAPLPPAPQRGWQQGQRRDVRWSPTNCVRN